MLRTKDGLEGNASTATILQTGRTLTIGSTGKSFNGSSNVSWSLSEIGALPLTGGTLTGEVTFKDYLSVNAWEGYGEGKAQIWYNGITNSLLLQPPVKDIQINGRYVYHQGRIPTPSEIGALSVSGGTVTGKLTVDWMPPGENAIMLIKTDPDGNGKGDGNTHIGYNTGQGYSHYFRGSGYMHIETLRGCTISNNLLVDKDLYVGNSVTTVKLAGQVGQTVEVCCHLTPTSTEWYNLGQSHAMFGDIFTKRGALNGSDISFKENIKDIASNNNIQLYSSENIYDDTITLSDLYEYVKNINIKSFNYKNTEENILGIIANEIPDNIFNKIGIINKNNERILFATAQIAMIQGALKEAINKIEILENKIKITEGGDI